jgi:hypothetical protein
LFQLAIFAEAMHTAVAVTVGDIQIARGCRHQLGRVVERPGCAQRQNFPVFATGVGVLAARAQLFEQFAVECIDQRDVVVLISHINNVIDDLEAVRAFEQACTPGADVFTLVVENQHRRIFALKNIQPVLRIGGDTADHADGFARRHFCEVLDEFVGVFARANFHVRLLACGVWVYRDGAILAAPLPLVRRGSKLR